MLICRKLLILSFFVMATPVAMGQQFSSVVTTKYGRISGKVENGVLSFKGIPYATSPIGNNRWKEPQPLQVWKDVLKADSFACDCVQKAMPGDAAASGDLFCENCLFLNVWRPVAKRIGLPVLIWIHGGGFTNGGSATPLNDGATLAKQGIVVVSINYRLGRLGLFAHPVLSKAKEGPLGNYAFMDQLVALKWIKQNIASFGGNPNQITIMGESAGGISVIHHLTSKKAAGLFHRAIVLSGGGRTYLKEKSLAEAEESGIIFADSMGIRGSDTDVLNALRNLPAEKATGDLNMLSLITKPKTFVGGVILDGEVVDALPEKKLRDGNFSKVPLLIGTTSNDLGVIPAPSLNPLSWFGSLEQQAANLYNKNNTLNPLELWMLVSQDVTMHEQARFAARQFRRAGQPVWLYRFDYVADSLRAESKGAEHASELPYLFGTINFRYKSAATESDRQMSKLFQSYIVNFIKTGNPNGSKVPEWKLYQPAGNDVMMFSAGGAAMQTDPLSDRLNLVEQRLMMAK